LAGLENAKAAGIRFQLNTTVTRRNRAELPAILDQAIRLGAMTWDLFFLVPTGRGSAIRDLELSPVDYERALHWVFQKSQQAPLRIKTTCAPHYVRIQQQERVKARKSSAAAGPGSGGRPVGEGHPAGRAGGADPNYVSGGCMAGDGFVFISHRGVLQTCGFLDIPCGDLRREDYDFKRAYLESEVFNQVRQRDRYDGKCGLCEFRMACGGCRARAYARYGDYMGSEPNCIYVPEDLRKDPAQDRITSG
jgi:radical SAM protein with 4Fe4S-binding SPASM domain